ncbi:MAG TPA: hypothetical protein VF154_03725 [Terriglobales bacterium]
MPARIMLLLLAVIVLLRTPVLAQLEPVDLHHHKFWDKQNIAIHAANFAMQTADAFTTRHVLDEHNGVERNPWARQFVSQGWGGQAAYSWGLSVGGTILTSYFMHRTGHHRTERILPMIEIGVTAGAVFGMNLRHRETPPR